MLKVKNLISEWIASVTGSKKQQENNKVLVRTWTKAEEQQLTELINSGVPKSRISEITGRSIGSINYKLTQLFNSSNVKTLTGSQLTSK